MSTKPRQVHIEVDSEIRHDTVTDDTFVRCAQGEQAAEREAKLRIDAELTHPNGGGKANGLEPYAYLHRVFTALPAATTFEDIEALLPWT